MRIWPRLVSHFPCGQRTCLPLHNVQLRALQLGRLGLNRNPDDPLTPDDPMHTKWSVESVYLEFRVFRVLLALMLKTKSRSHAAMTSQTCVDPRGCMLLWSVHYGVPFWPSQGRSPQELRRTAVTGLLAAA